MIFYAFTGLINAITSLILGGFVYLKNVNSIINKAFSLFALSVAFWSLGYFFWQTAQDPENALLWSRILMVGAIFVPVLYFHFIISLLDLYQEKKKFLVSGYIFSVLFFFLNFTPLFVKEVVPKLSFSFWPNPGIAFHPFLLMFSGYVVYSWYLMYKAFKNLSGTKREQVKYVFIGTLIGFLGGSTNYLLWYDIPVPPFGNILVSIYVMLMAYAILKYRLMDVRLALSRGLIYVFSLAIVIASAFFLVFLRNQYLEIIPLTVIMPGILVFGILVFHPILFRLEEFASRHFHYTFYNYREILIDLGKKLGRILDLDKLSSLITDTLLNTMRLDRAVILLREEGTGEYRIQKNVGFKEENGISLVKDNFLTGYLEKTQEPLVFDELSLIIRDTYDREERDKIKNLQDNMKRIEASLCLPLLSKDRIIGMIVLGDKVSGDPYFEQDIDLLSGLANQASIALQNAMLYSQVNDLSTSLERKVEEQTKEIKKAYEELKASDKAKSVFISMASHQLRTPLASLRGYASMLLEGMYGKLPERSEAKVKIMLSSSERLIEIVNKLLSISKIDLGKIETVKTREDMRDLVTFCLEEMRAEGEQKGLKMICKVPKKKIEVNVDASQIKEVLTNIIQNAIHYTEKGMVEIGVKKGVDGVTVYVKDTGEGMEKDEKSEVFRSFTRGRAGINKFIEGAGLGLYLSKKYIELHNGKIWAESKGKGKGSIFYIKIPA